MRISRQNRQFVRRLVSLSQEEGTVSAARVRQVLDVLTTKPRRDLRRILKAYRYFILREIQASTARVEHAGEIDQEILARIGERFSGLYGRPVTVESRENLDLLGGLRVRIGDDVYDHSVAGRLDILARNIA